MASTTSDLYQFDDNTKNMWWALVMGGVLSVIFGFVAIIWPGITVGVLALLLAVFIGVLGVLDIVHSVKQFGVNAFKAFLQLVLGLLEVGVGVYLLSNVGSGLAIATLILLLVLSFIVRGVITIVLAFADPDYKATRWLNVGVGALSVIVGLVIAWWPVGGTLAWVWVVGFFAIVAGAIQIALGFTAKEALKK